MVQCVRNPNPILFHTVWKPHHIVHGPHVVQAVGQLNQHDSRVVDHAQKHHAKLLNLERGREMEGKERTS